MLDSNLLNITIRKILEKEITYDDLEQARSLIKYLSNKYKIDDAEEVVLEHIENLLYNKRRSCERIARNKR